MVTGDAATPGCTPPETLAGLQLRRATRTPPTAGDHMTIYLIAGVVIPLALCGITYAIRVRPRDRAETYPLGSSERRILEGGL